MSDSEKEEKMTQPAEEVEKETDKDELSAQKVDEKNLAEPEAKKSEAEKKSPVVPILVLLLAVLSVVGVFFAVKAFLPPEEVPAPVAQVDPKLKEDATDILFTKETLPRVDASLATQPLVNAFVENFTGQTTEELGIEYSNTHPGYVKLINNEADLIVVTEPSEGELELAAENDVELDVTKVVNEGFVFFVNKNNPVDSVTMEDLVKIYTGEITNWKELGGNDAEIVAYQRPENSGSQTGLYSLVLKGEPVKIPTVKESVTLSMSGIVDYVANYENSVDAIGYGFYYYVNTMYYNDNLKYLAVDGVKPTYKTIQDGSYPILSAYYIVTRKGDENQNVAELKAAMLSPRGQKIASEAGYVPAK